MAEMGFEPLHLLQNYRNQNLQPFISNVPSYPPSPTHLFTPLMPTHELHQSPNLNPPICQPFLDDRPHDAVSVRVGDSFVLDSNFRSASVPMGPFTGYALILKRSRFLKPAQQLLEDFCGPGHAKSDSNPLDEFNTCIQLPISASARVEFKNSKLMFMLEEVYKKYRLYCQQIQTVYASFETVSGLGNAAPYVSCAMKAISKHFGFLKNAILDQIHQFSGKITAVANNTSGNNINESSSFWNYSETNFHKRLNTDHNLKNSVWRSQRGLPENAVAVLKRWLFEHFLHPYPTDLEKHMLAQQTGLSRTQVSNWFINSRVRLWKPMVEEMHNIESQQRSYKQTHPETANSSIISDYNDLENSISAENMQFSCGKDLDYITTKRSRNEQYHGNLLDNYCTNTEKQRIVGVDNSKSNLVGMIRSERKIGVSLALSLQQGTIGVDQSSKLFSNDHCSQLHNND